jgi:hypothetical protein
MWLEGKLRNFQNQSFTVPRAVGFVIFVDLCFRRVVLGRVIEKRLYPWIQVGGQIQFPMRNVANQLVKVLNGQWTRY